MNWCLSSQACVRLQSLTVIGLSQVSEQLQTWFLLQDLSKKSIRTDSAEGIKPPAALEPKIQQILSSLNSGCEHACPEKAKSAVYRLPEQLQT